MCPYEHKLQQYQTQKVVTQIVFVDQNVVTLIHVKNVRANANYSTNANSTKRKLYLEPSVRSTLVTY